MNLTERIVIVVIILAMIACIGKFVEFASEQENIATACRERCHPYTVLKMDGEYCTCATGDDSYARHRWEDLQ